MDWFNFKIQTNKGAFHLSVEEDSSNKAVSRVSIACSNLELTLLGLIRARRDHGIGPQTALLYYSGKVAAGQSFWYAIGRGAEFEAQEVLDEYYAKRG